MSVEPPRTPAPPADERGFLSLLTGSFATPAAENPTVAMVEAAYAHHGLDARYLNCDVAPGSLADAVRGAVAMGWVGFNCSLPHKQAVIGLLDELTDAARLIGAVNCVVRDGDRLVGENTDGKGFVESLRTVVDPAGASVLVVGAGGAGRAVAVETALAGAARVTVLNRSGERGREVAALVDGSTPAEGVSLPWEGRVAVPAGTDIVVQATSVGLFPGTEDVVDLDLDSLDASVVVADVVPNPPRTRLLREAEQRGCRTLDGLGMLVEQGAVAIRLWTGVDPDRAVMRQALTDIFG
ncbi:shikimate dehydrogenase [Nocardioides scoriae]|uniref:Shikimate dehydrogenase (NADP(+)) n=1 Tax=Nocardioides scoriae TaxID=642780 RepID=A0A1H1W3W9_9ACTN|nr:shikimate dehydrogenase [Nocardioides scoriae]SDS90889.1 shikimate dehydrogenase [Nocardioides scoriae]